jgi:radical SAM superfamily enzyme YgiQ (UPF0313 family)
MHYTDNLIRPPSEADSIILQVTEGCSHNKCTFCGAYKETPFAIKNDQLIDEDLAFARHHFRRQKRLFLADGDVLILSQKRLVNLLEKIRQALPWIKRVSLYGNAKSVRSKTSDQLRELKSLGLNRVYLGLESGCDEVLQSVIKGETAKSMIAAARKIRQEDLFLSVTALLGLGGTKLSKQHAEATAEVLTKMAPNQIAILTLMPLENTLIGQRHRSGQFTLPSPEQMLRELRSIVSNLGDIRCQFHANHASSYLPLAGRLPRDKDALLATIDQALAGTIQTVAESRRAL